MFKLLPRKNWELITISMSEQTAGYKIIFDGQIHFVRSIDFKFPSTISCVGEKPVLSYEDIGDAYSESADIIFSKESEELVSISLLLDGHLTYDDSYKKYSIFINENLCISGNSIEYNLLPVGKVLSIKKRALELV